MAREPEDIVLRLLRDIRATQTEQADDIKGLVQQIERLTKRFEDLRTVALHTIGLGNEAKLKNDEQDVRLDEIFDKLEQLLGKH